MSEVVKFSKDENTVEVDGSKYSAVAGEPGRCDGCEFKKGFGCYLVERGLLFNGYGYTHCQAAGRGDGRSIVWQLSARLVRVAPSPE